ncbi:hypothetical protein HYS47_05050 [Candidatus Woesearchaeota archaeon]|nr:hypothetical protein [Candidatus Woesearchaeota archaeon]
MAGIGLFNVFTISLAVGIINFILGLILVAKHETVKRTRVVIGVLLLFTTIALLIFSVLYLFLLTTVPQTEL